MSSMTYPLRNAELKPENKQAGGKDTQMGMCARCRKAVYVYVRLCDQCVRDLTILDHAKGKYPPRG
jgi:predicted amidophosphoribosyltransferase